MRGKQVVVRDLRCPTCDRPLFFDNDRCLADDTPVGFEPGTFAMVPLVQGGAWARCANAELAGCNWVVPADRTGSLCTSCALTRTRPDDDDGQAHERFVEAEAAKRRLVAQLVDLGLPIVSFQDADDGLGFDLLSSRFDQVMIGHEDGLITLDLAETDDAHRERVRAELGEAYRTVLGHFRHEVGHYYWAVLVRDAGRLEEFRERFGDERADYGDALSSHHGGDGPQGWEDTHVSAYATMHPWEDWAETFAHYLHLRDTLQTAAETGVRVHGAEVPGGEAPPADVDDLSFEAMIPAWMALSTALNALNRSMGAADLYPFVLAPTVVDKLAYVDDLVRTAGGGR